MFIALDEQGNRAAADAILSCSQFFCPGCNEPVYPRCIKVNIKNKRPHVAHHKDSKCPYSLDKDRDHEWHIRMQKYFSLDQWEHRFTDPDTGELHIADIFIPESKMVLEFQHSPISEEEFWSRTNFYINKCGYRLVWLFDESVDKPEKYPYGRFLPYNLVSSDEIPPAIWAPCQYKCHDDNPYINRCFLWSECSRKVLLEKIEHASRKQQFDGSKLAVCVFTGLKGDCFHRLQFHRFEDVQTIVTFSLHDILMKEGMDVEEFFQPEIKYWENNQWLIAFLRSYEQQKLQKPYNQQSVSFIRIPLRLNGNSRYQPPKKSRRF